MAAILEFFNVFETFEDVSTEYKLKKIKYNADEFSKFCNKISSTSIKLTCVGFIGKPILVADACAKFLNLTEEETQQLSNNLTTVTDSGTSELLATTTEHLRENLLLVKKDTQIAFIYRKSDPIFNVGPLPSTVLAVDYVRYMVDVCEKMIVVSADDVTCDSDLVNLFRDTANTPILVQERSVQPNETVTITLLNNSQPLSLPSCNNKCNTKPNICRSQLLITLDHTRFLYT